MGTFNVIYTWVNDLAAGIYVRADKMDVQEADFATALSNCLTRDGQSLPTVDIPMGGFKFTGLGNGVSTTDSVTYAQVFNSPVFTGTPAAPTAAVGTNTTQLATTAFVVNTAMSAILPGISATTKGKFLTNDGTTSSWSPIVQYTPAIIAAGGF